MSIDPDPEPPPDTRAPNWAAIAKLVARIGYDLGQHLHHLHFPHEEHNFMPAVFVPGGPYLPAGTYPIRLFNNSDGPNVGFSAEFVNETGGLIIVAGIDATATSDAPEGPLFCDFSLGAATFYHDSQSIGEGKGVTYSWRGAHLLYPGEILQVSQGGSVFATVTFGFEAWGIVCQISPYGP